MALPTTHLGVPQQVGPLALFPVFLDRAHPSPGYVLAHGAVEVSEREGSPVVGQLVVQNRAAQPALLLEGDLLEGGHQDRVADRSVLVPAGQGVVVEVSCTERSRWSGSDGQALTRRRAPVRVRAALTQGQEEVWRRVDEFGERHGHGPTHALRDATASARARAAALVADVRPLFGQCGVLACVAGQPLVLDVVDSPRTFRAVYGPLLRALALDALDAPCVPTPGRRARRFVERVRTTTVAPTAEAGLGLNLHGGSAYADVRALAWGQRLPVLTAVNVRSPLLAG